MIENNKSISKIFKKKYVWKKNSYWNGRWINFKLDERITKIIENEN